MTKPPSETSASAGGASAEALDCRPERVAALEARLALLEAVVDGLPDPLFVKDLEHRFLYVNERLAEFVAHERSRMIGRDDREFFPEDQVRVFWLGDDEVLRGGVPNEQIERIVDGDGREHLISTRKAPALDPQGRPMLVGTIRDVTDALTRVAEQDLQLRSVRDLLGRTAQQAHIGIVLLDRHGRFLFAAGPDLARMGVTADQIEGVHYRSVGPIWPELVPLLDAALVGEARAQILSWRGRQRHVSTAPVIDAAGALVGATVFSFDLSEQQEQARREARAQRMDSLGRLAGGVAHDLNNLLSIVMMGTSALRDSLAAGELEGVRSQLRVLERSVDRGSRLSRQLASFARRQVGPPTVVDLHAHLGPTRVFLESLVHAGIELEFRFGPGAPRVRLQPGQVEQIVINLVLHAASGMPQGGRVRIETEPMEIEADPELLAGSYVALRVVDEAPTLSATARERLFEPFVDADGRATGLGLATCYGIAAQARGRVRALVPSQGGNVTEVLLPRTQDAVTTEILSFPRVPVEHRSLRILLAEDEPVLRNQLVELLRTVGHQVTAVADGRQALDGFHDHPGAFDLVLSDVLMPVMTGVDLALALEGQVPIVLMSGFVADAAEAVPDLATRFTTLVKPVKPASLLQALQEAVGR